MIFVIAMETAQLSEIMPGVFDYGDILVEVLGVVASVCVISIMMKEA